MLEISIPTFCLSEIEYVCSVVFTEWLGIDYQLRQSGSKDLFISFAEKKLKLNASFFIKAESDWFENSSMPVLPLSRYNLNELKNSLSSELHICEAELPVLYGTPEIKFDENSIDCRIDILGGIFFMLSRYEEIVVKERDLHDRFSAKSSVAYKEDFLFRPIANEYLELLFALINFLWPNLKRKERKFTISPTHDVDVPFYYLNLSITAILRKMLADVVKRKSLKKALNTYISWKNTNKKSEKYDPAYTFDFIMDESKKRSIISSFYFLPSSSPEILFKYPVEVPQMKNLLRSICERKHEIGIHGFYGTSTNQEAFIADVKLLKETMELLNIDQLIKGGRQHFLHWQNPKTFNVWEAAGMEYDSSLTFADIPGFRCGTCYEYSVYDCLRRKKLKLKERPLIVMECSVIDSPYMNLGLTDSALNIFKILKEKCCYYNGDYVILFHNDRLVTDYQKEFYIKVLDC